jgi:hypothetical protein
MTDKTVGGMDRSTFDCIGPSNKRPRDKSRVLISSPMGAVSLTCDEWDAFLAAAFDSRGIRDGLERAAKIADAMFVASGGEIAAAIREEASKLDGQPQRPCAADPDGRPCPDLEHCDPCAQRDIFIAGKPAPLPPSEGPVLATIVYDHKERTVRVERPARCQNYETERREPPRTMACVNCGLLPDSHAEPPSEERKLPLGRRLAEGHAAEVTPAYDDGSSAARCRCCGQPRSAHEPAR